MIGVIVIKERMVLRRWEGVVDRVKLNRKMVW